MTPCRDLDGNRHFLGLVATNQRETSGGGEDRAAVGFPRKLMCWNEGLTFPT